MNYEIREMLERDATQVLEIYEQGIQRRTSTFETEVPTWEIWDSEFLKDCRFVIENEEEKIIGWCALKPISKRPCYRGVAEVSIYLDEQFQSRGLGKILLKKIILDSEYHGFWTLQVGIFSENKSSMALFQNQGFRTVGFRERIAQLDGVWRNVTLLERRSQE